MVKLVLVETLVQLGVKDPMENAGPLDQKAVLAMKDLRVLTADRDHVVIWAPKERLDLKVTVET